MKHIVCFSGGESSALVAEAVVRRYGREAVTLLNHDINPSKEDADVKRFKAEVAAALGMQITYANYEGLPAEQLPDQFDVCKTAFKRPGSGNALCTYYLKTKPFTDYLAANTVPAETIVYYGFDDDEQHRILRRRFELGKLGYVTCFPLAEWAPTEHYEGIHQLGVLPPNGYSTYRHANCAGCLKGGMQHWYVTYCHRPDVYAKAQATEARLGYSILSKEVANPEANACESCGGLGYVVAQVATAEVQALMTGEPGWEFEEYPEACPACKWAPKVKAPLWLADLREVFARMKCAGVPDTEHYPESKFKRYLKQYRLPEISLFAPCECAA